MRRVPGWKSGRVDQEKGYHQNLGKFVENSRLTVQHFGPNFIELLHDRMLQLGKTNAIHSAEHDTDGEAL